jgi:hypothetical protein
VDRLHLHVGHHAAERAASLLTGPIGQGTYNGMCQLKIQRVQL